MRSTTSLASLPSKIAYGAIDTPVIGKPTLFLEPRRAEQSRLLAVFSRCAPLQYDFCKSLRGTLLTAPLQNGQDFAIGDFAGVTFGRQPDGERKVADRTLRGTRNPPAVRIERQADRQAAGSQLVLQRHAGQAAARRSLDRRQQIHGSAGENRRTTRISKTGNRQSRL